MIDLTTFKVDQILNFKLNFSKKFDQNFNPNSNCYFA